MLGREITVRNGFWLKVLIFQHIDILRCSASIMDGMTYRSLIEISKMKEGDTMWVYDCIFTIFDEDLKMSREEMSAFRCVHVGDKEDFSCGDEFIVIECVKENPLSPQSVNERVESLEGWSVKEEIKRETYMTIDMEEGIERNEFDDVFYETYGEIPYSNEVSHVLETIKKFEEIEMCDEVFSDAGLDATGQDFYAIMADWFSRLEDADIVGDSSANFYECKYALDQAGVNQIANCYFGSWGRMKTPEEYFATKNA